MEELPLVSFGCKAKGFAIAMFNWIGKYARGSIPWAIFIRKGLRRPLA